MKTPGVRSLEQIDRDEETRREPSAPSELDGVGPVTAAVVATAEFDAADIAERRVSYRELLEAGANRGMAERLRQTYSLVWSFVWRPGADLGNRAEQVGGLSDGERRWITESVRDRSNGGEGGADRAESHGTDDCPRCGAELVTYTLAGSEATECGACGFTGVSVENAVSGSPGSDRSESRDDVLRRSRDGGRS